MADTALRKNIVAACALVFLSGCVQTIISSTMLVDESKLSDSRRNALVDQVYQKAESLGGHCKLVNTERQVHVCPLPIGTPVFTLSLGYSPRGPYSISIESTRGHWFPPSEEDVVAGIYLPDLQRDLEAWMRSLVAQDAILSARRSYIGYGTSEQF